MVGNMFSWGKPTGAAGNQEFVLWKNRTGQLMGKERGRIISRASLEIDIQLSYLSSGSQNWINCRLTPHNLTNTLRPSPLLSRAKLRQCLHVSNVLFDGLGGGLMLSQPTLEYVTMILE